MAGWIPPKSGFRYADRMCISTGEKYALLVRLSSLFCSIAPTAPPTAGASLPARSNGGIQTSKLMGRLSVAPPPQSYARRRAWLRWK